MWGFLPTESVFQDEGLAATGLLQSSGIGEFGSIGSRITVPTLKYFG